MKVGPVRRRAEEAFSFLDIKGTADFFCDLRRCGCSETTYTLSSDLLCKPSHLKVVGTKRVPPFGDAVSFIDGKEPDSTAYSTHRCNEALVVEPFGSAVQNIQGSIAHRLDSRKVLVLAFGRVQDGRTDPAALQSVNLIFHQRNERGHD